MEEDFDVCRLEVSAPHPSLTCSYAYRNPSQFGLQKRMLTNPSDDLQTCLVSTPLLEKNLSGQTWRKINGWNAFQIKLRKWKGTPPASLDDCLCMSSRLAPWWEIAPTTQLTAPIICKSPARPTRSRWCQFLLHIELSAWLSVIERCIGVWKDDTGPLERLQNGGAQELLSNIRSHVWLHYLDSSPKTLKFLYFDTTKPNIPVWSQRRYK